MRSSSFLQWSGLAVMAGGVLSVISVFIALMVINSSTWLPYVLFVVLALPAGGLVQVGLVGLYVKQAEKAGHLGWISFAISFFGASMVNGAIWRTAFAPAMAQDAPRLLEADASGLVRLGLVLSFSLLSSGLFLFGVSALRAKVYPREAAAPLIIGSVLSILSVPLVIPSSPVLTAPLIVLVVCGVVTVVIGFLALGFDLSFGLFNRLVSKVTKR